MVGDAFRKVTPGERLDIPAPAYNAFIDAARMARGMHGAAGVPQWRHSDLVTVKNISGSDQDRFSVLGIDGPLFTPTENLHEFCDYVGFKVTTPVEGLAGHRNRFVVLAEPIAADGIGAAVVSGATQVKLDVTEEFFNYADVWEGRTDVLKPEVTPSGTLVLWRQPGLGEKWAYVRLSNLPYH